MTKPHCAISFCAALSRVQLAMLASLLLLSGCASTGFVGPDDRNRPMSSGSNDVPLYVQNLPKSRTGNMQQYTVFGKQYKVMDSAANFTEQGTASWYGEKFHGRKTSSGEVYDMHAMTAAHKHLPLPTFVRVTNLENNLSVVVKVNDRGPFVGERIIDMSYAAAQQLGMVEKGTAQVFVEGLSTHLVAQNESITEPAIAPEVLPAEVAAVPVAPAVEPVAQITVDVSEDGFDEAPELGAALVAIPDENIDTGSALEQGNIYIQLGAFSSAENAHTLVSDVDEQTGLPAYVERDRDNRLYRVKMGPFQQGQLLDNTLESLASVGIDSYTKMAKQY